MQRSFTLAFIVLAAATAFVPEGAAAPCDTSAPDVTCEGSAGRCDYSAGASIITSTGAEADCRGGNMTRCHAEASVGANIFDPTIDHWCAF